MKKGPSLYNCSPKDEIGSSELYHQQCNHVLSPHAWLVAWCHRLGYPESRVSLAWLYLSHGGSLISSVDRTKWPYLSDLSYCNLSVPNSRASSSRSSCYRRVRCDRRTAYRASSLFASHYCSLHDIPSVMHMPHLHTGEAQLLYVIEAQQSTRNATGGASYRVDRHMYMSRSSITLVT
ncbi:Uncharacterized protein HZ326_1378 [Fusarium oxysporum f. sp. albedinis]|nr:Uncharacterized protein HZ326_1378 [Fusarium oxysporum f. sp. albedinis]